MKRDIGSNLIANRTGSFLRVSTPGGVPLFFSNESRAALLAFIAEAFPEERIIAPEGNELKAAKDRIVELAKERDSLHMTCDLLERQRDSEMTEARHAERKLGRIHAILME